MRDDDFSMKTKRLLAHRVGHRCSNPDCRAPTSGPGVDSDVIVTAGDAAHITAASPGGPRYDPTLTSEQRRSYDNGIWLCVVHARIIDQDESGHPAGLLHRWKAAAVELAKNELSRSQGPRLISSVNEVEQFSRIAQAIVSTLKKSDHESSAIGIQGLLSQLSSASQLLCIPVPIEICTLPYAEGDSPHHPFLQDRYEGRLAIRFPDGTEQSGIVAHASGIELLLESRSSAIISLEQWIILLGGTT